MSGFDKKLSKNIIYKLILNIVNLIVPLLIGPYIMRIFTPNQIGRLSFAQTIIGYFFVFASLGVYQYGLREISRVRDSKEKVQKVFTNLITITLGTNIIAFIIYIIVAVGLYRHSDIYIILLILSINFFSNSFYVEWINEATENYDFITKKSIVIRIVYILLIVFFIKTSNNFYEYIGILVLSTCVNNLVSYLYVKRKFKFDFSEMRIGKHIKPMVCVVILTNAGMLYTQMDKFLLGEFSGNVQIAYYTTGQNIMRVINLLLITLIEATIPRLSKYAVNDNFKYNELLNQVIKSYLIFLFPAALGLCFLGTQVMELYAGKEYIGAGTTLSIFAIYMITIGYENIISNQIMYIQGKEKIQIAMNFIGGFFNVILNIGLGIMGVLNSETAIINTLVCNIIVVLAQYVYIKKYLKQIDVRFIDKETIVYIGVSMLFFPIIYMIKEIIHNTIFIIITSIIICSIIYIIGLIINKDKFLNSILNKIKK